jgi:hypothetical protein
MGKKLVEARPSQRMIRRATRASPRTRLIAYDMAADPRQIIADLHRQLDERTVAESGVSTQHGIHSWIGYVLDSEGHIFEFVCYDSAILSG